VKKAYLPNAPQFVNRVLFLSFFFLDSRSRNKKFESLYLDGQISLELVPQGTLVERIRAHAAGIPAFYTPTGASTAVELGSIPIRYNRGGFANGVSVRGVPKEARVFEGRRYVLEESIKGDVAFVRAWKVDEVGNCVFRWGDDTMCKCRWYLTA
jgi:3-oxoacid CoA-transferase